ncbi:hypothetical protein KEM52_006613 [Ascosphaera acerosa]|nr:hypothetical protein KEM52_006613 [Ascosphaera acerosa]
MRATLRLFASVKPAAAAAAAADARTSAGKAGTYLTPGSATGLAGLLTHPHPRPALLHAYKTTLQKLRAFPESSAYRKSVEALTAHRLAIVERTKPAGFAEWEARVKEAVQQDEKRRAFLGVDGSYVVPLPEQGKAEDLDFYGVEGKAQEEGAAVTEEEARAREAELLKALEANEEEKIERLPQEPPLTAAQVSQIENEIGAGLLEEVLQVAEGELQLVDKMYEAKVWEELEEKPLPGQWKYFERAE